MDFSDNNIVIAILKTTGIMLTFGAVLVSLIFISEWLREWFKNRKK